MLTGGFSEVDRARRVAIAQAEFRAEMKDWPAERLEAFIARQYPAYWLKVDLPHKVTQAQFRPCDRGGRQEARHQRRLRCRARRHRADGARARPSVAAVDHRRRVRARRRQHRRCADLHHDRRARARHDLAVARIRARRRRGTPRRAHRRRDRKGRARRSFGCRTSSPSAPSPKGRLKAFAIEPEVSINNQWSNRYTVVEVTGLDRPGLLYELTTTLSKLNLNIASAHVATFGERVVDVFYVTDLVGAQIDDADPPGGDQARADRVVHGSRRRRQSDEGSGRGLMWNSAEQCAEVSSSAYSASSTPRRRSGTSWWCPGSTSSAWSRRGLPRQRAPMLRSSSSANAIDGAVTIITEASRKAILRMWSPSKRPPVTSPASP